MIMIIIGDDQNYDHDHQDDGPTDLHHLVTPHPLQGRMVAVGLANGDVMILESSPGGSGLTLRRRMVAHISRVVDVRMDPAKVVTVAEDGVKVRDRVLVSGNDLVQYTKLRADGGPCLPRDRRED
jgi:hypothetical protein